MTTQTRNKIDSIAFKGLLLALAMFLVWYFITLPVLRASYRKCIQQIRVTVGNPEAALCRLS